MGFELELHLLYLQKNEAANTEVWIAEEALVFGRVTRMEKLGPNFRHVRRSPHERAGICTVSIMLGKVFAEIGREANMSVYAPPIVNLDDDESHNAYFDERDRLLKAGMPSFIDLYGGSLSIRRSLDPRKRRRHNALHAMPKEEFLAAAAKAHPILHPPFLWESCANLADWLHDSEAADTEEWSEVRRDSVSLALFRGWRAYLREVGEVGARALFIFPR